METTTLKNPHASALARLAVGPRIYDRAAVTRIFARLKAGGWTRAQIADAMGVGVNTVSYWINGNRNPPIDLEFLPDSPSL